MQAIVGQHFHRFSAVAAGRGDVDEGHAVIAADHLRGGVEIVDLALDLGSIASVLLRVGVKPNPGWTAPAPRWVFAGKRSRAAAAVRTAGGTRPAAGRGTGC
jgi:hypothetical protein